MATQDTTHAVQLNECIPGSLMDTVTTGTTDKNDLSRILKGCEAEEDEQTGQEDKSQTNNSNRDNTASLPEALDVLRKEQITIPGELNKEEYKQASSKESKEVTILQEDQNEVSKLRIRRDADLYPEEPKKQSRVYTSSQQEDAVPTIEGDNKTPKEVEEFDEKKQLAKEDFNMAYHKEELSADSQPDVEMNQEGKEDRAGQNGTVPIVKEEALSFASDNKVKVDEEDFKERQDPRGPHQERHMSTTQHLEPCEGRVSSKELEGNFDSKGSCKAASDQDKMDIRSQIILQGKETESFFSPKDAIAQNIQQGELLLYRLHIVQQNQELQQVSDGPLASNTAAMVMTSDTMENVTMMPDTEGEDDGGEETDLSLRVETTEKKESEVQRYQTETGDHKEAKMEKEVSDDDQSDSGVSADFFPGGIHELSTSYSQNIRPTEETPIQREIREGLEREKTLRQLRGLDDWGERSQELVEITVKRSLEAAEQTTNFGFDAEKRLAKRKMLQDINQEAMKEQALKKLGTLPGFYSRGHAQDLKERQMLFDAFHQCKKMDTQGSSRCKKFFSSSFTAGDAENLAVQGDGLPFVSVFERTRSLELFTNYQFKDPAAPLRGTESDAASETESHKEYLKTSDGDATQDPQSKSLCLSISLDSLDWDSGIMSSYLDNEKEDEEGSFLKRKNPFFQLRPALSLRPDVEMEIREAIKREQELRRLRSRLYGDQGNNLADKQEENTRSSCVESSSTESDHVYRGKLTLIWPPPSSKVEKESGPPNPFGQRPTLQHRWENGTMSSSYSERD